MAREDVFQSTLPARGATGNMVEAFQAVVAFQSTLPARGATCNAAKVLLFIAQFQSTLPARGATDILFAVGLARAVSIHAPREGSDPAFSSLTYDYEAFQSTLPARGATAETKIVLPFFRGFNPRSPRGERLAD